MLFNVASRALVIWDTCLKVLFGILMLIIIRIRELTH